MIMRPGQQLLLPANPLFIWGSLVVALVIDMLPFAQAAWMPQLVAVLLAFWIVHQPRRIGVITAFVFGVATDVHQAGLLGQHALAYGILGFFAVTIHRRLLWFAVHQQALQVLPLFVLAHAVSVTVRLLAGGSWPGWPLLLAPVLEAALWLPASVLLLAPQRRAPDPDENRPL